MFPKEHLHLIVRDEGLVPAARALADVAEVASQRLQSFEAAALFGMAACLAPHWFSTRADEARVIREPENAYEAVLGAVADHAAAFRNAVGREMYPLYHLRDALFASRLSSQALWLARLVRAVMTALEEAWGGETPPRDDDPLPEPEVPAPEGWQQVQA